MKIENLGQAEVGTRHADTALPSAFQRLSAKKIPASLGDE